MTHDLKKFFILALKIALGSSAAIWAAESLGLQFAASAGSITLLTLLTTKLETLRLSAQRLITFAIAAVLGVVAFKYISHDWTAYGIYTFFVVFLSYLFGVKTTVSVNAVIGTHFLSAQVIDAAFVFNEFLLVVIGIIIAVVMNLFHDYRGDRRKIRENIDYTEKHMRIILEEAAQYLKGAQGEKNVWRDVAEFENEIHGFIRAAYEYQDNTFTAHPRYYIDYFEMRMDQCRIIHSLHYEMKKMRSMPAQAPIIADYILYLKNYVVEMNRPENQLAKLHGIISAMQSSPLPESRDEFEARAMLYHIMMDLEEFLKAKARFVDKLDEKQIKKYWSN